MSVRLTALCLLTLACTSRLFADGIIISMSKDDSFFKASIIGEDGVSQALLDSDSLSSGWILSVRGKQKNPVEDGWRRDEWVNVDGLALRYMNEDISLVQRARVSPDGWHVLVSVRITNLSGNPVNVKPGLLLDTHQGDVSGLPFTFSDGTQLGNEKTIIIKRKKGLPEWIQSYRNLQTHPFTLLLNEPFRQNLERIVLANWFRLKREGLSIKTDSSRDFSFLPFSRDDSGMLLLYQTKKLQSGESYEIQLAFGVDGNTPNFNWPERIAGSNSLDPDIDDDSSDGEETPSAVVESEGAVPVPVIGGDSPMAAPDDGSLVIIDREELLRERMLDLSALISAVDVMLDGEGVSEERILEMENEVQRQEGLRRGYEDL